MKIAVRTHGPVGDTLNHVGGGETRWVSNMAHFLATEGHTVVRCLEGQDVGCDLFLDASWERCQRSQARAHVHFSFFGWTSGIAEFPCIHTGRCNIALPYRLIWLQNQNIKKNVPFQYQNLFFPQPYPDDLLPPAANQVPGFQRREILWATKDMFHPNFEPQKRDNGKEHVFIQGGLDTLRALIKLQNKADFKVNFLLKHLIDMAPARLGVPELLSQIREKEFYNYAPWTQLLEIGSRCKLNVPVGGLWGSIPESIFVKSVPMFFQRNCFSSDIGTILPVPELCDEHDIYGALETLWFDEATYNRMFEIQQAMFADHRTDGLRKNIKIAFEKLGL